MKAEYWILAGIAVLAGVFSVLDWKAMEYLAYGAFGLYAIRRVFTEAD